ncbi:hypothetical protein EVA_07760 [gut metagenome]|uniref:Uncharacterized protein n=1 Tax=gut metagenome TaxID=749906 RepID=J9GA32_9ZZZZ
MGAGRGFKPLSNVCSMIRRRPILPVIFPDWPRPGKR